MVALVSSTNSSLNAAGRQSENSAALDSSAYLALILGEPGDGAVLEAIANGAIISAVNEAEVIARLLDLKYDRTTIQRLLLEFAVPVVPVTLEVGRTAGYLRDATRSLGLSLGDRVCLALAAELGIPALTADRAWAQLDAGIEIILCR